MSEKKDQYTARLAKKANCSAHQIKNSSEHKRSPADQDM